jgi:RNA polymerase subunit RPABC4/transcription elongation factor Spt4
MSQAGPQTKASASTLCSNCGAAVPVGKQFCTRCGHALNAATQSQVSPSTSLTASTGPASQQQAVAGVKCARCGAVVTTGKRFCTTCGGPIPTKPPQDYLPVAYPPNPPVIKGVHGNIKSVEMKPGDKTTQSKPPGAMPSPARSRLLRIALPIVAAIVVAVGLFFIYTQFIRKPAPLDDKQLLETYYGPPPFFTVILAKDASQPSTKPVRREVWVYPDRKVSFVFLGGKYQFSADLQAISKSATKAANKLRIEQITDALTVDDLSKLVGSKPVSEATLPKEELPDATRYEYGNGINAVFSQGRLLMVRILPAPEGK